MLTRAARADLFGDAINEGVVVGPGRVTVATLTGMDNHVIDGVVEKSAGTLGGLSHFVRRVQNGYVRSYALSVLSGVLLLLVAVLAVNFA